MAYTRPSAAEIKARFPEFDTDDVLDPYVELVISDAETEVGPTWIEAFRRRAVMLLTAHWIAAYQASQAYISPVTGAAVAGPIMSETVGPLSIKYKGAATSGAGGASDGATADDYSSSSYGLEYLTLRKRSFPAVAIV